ncbi:MAG: MAPEG family protein [Rhodobiaceae bacterium]|nr:MAPEG family protein [Rhodobiaceae bacterium]
MLESPLLHLTLFAGWTIFLLILVELVRAWLMSARGYAVTAFPSGERHGPDAYWRLYRAQANCLEFLPMYGVVIGAMIVSGEAIPPLFAQASLVIVAARPLQSLVHITSTSAPAIRLRASLFLLQLTALAVMCWLTARSLLGAAP